MKKNSFGEKLKNWPIKKKLITSFGLIIVTTFILIATLLVGLLTTESKVRGLFEGPTTSTFYVGDIRFGLVANQRAINRVIAVGDSVLAEEEANMQSNIDLALAAMEVLHTTLISDENKVLLEEMGKQFEQEVVYRKELIALLDAGDFAGANDYDEEYYTPLVNEIRANADTLDQSIYAVGEDYAHDAEMIAIVMVIVGVVLLVLITGIAITIALKVTKIITEPVKQLEEAAKQLRVGDLTQEFGNITDFLGDFASIKNSFVVILKEFNNTLREIKEVSGHVDTGSDEVAATAGDLAPEQRSRRVQLKN